MRIDQASVDEALATTRAVRLRLDLERPVDLQIVLDCIDIAEQAPTGGNQGSRRWIVVRDQATKDRLAQLYLDAAGRWMIQARDRVAGTGHPQERVMASAAHLAEHLARVPLLVVPTILGTHDGSGRPGLFDSVIQAAWSFCVALRARGLGTAWTTAILSRQAELAEALDIPEGVTPIALFPVGWTKGTDFQRARRHPARAITYLDRFAHTYKYGPAEVPTLADGPGVVAERELPIPAAAAWTHLLEVASGRAAPQRIEVESPPAGNRTIRWSTGPATITDVTAITAITAITAQWQVEVESIAGATRLRASVVLVPDTRHDPSHSRSDAADRADAEPDWRQELSGQQDALHGLLDEMARVSADPVATPLPRRTATVVSPET